MQVLEVLRACHGYVVLLTVVTMYTLVVDWGIANL